MMVFNASGFDWDNGNRAKCQKHGVSIMEIEALLTGKPKIAPDMNHSAEEERYLAIGRTGTSRPLFVVYTLRNKKGKILMRPLHARYMHKKEIAGYEKT